MQAVKDQTTLAQAFVHALAEHPGLRAVLRLVMVGDGPLHADVQRILEAAGVAGLAWLPGERADVPDVMRGLDLFVLPSLAEGISNTILEAMASGLPVVATRVGGNAELLVEGATGRLVPADDPAAMAEAIVAYATDRDAARAAGTAGRAEVDRRFSMAAMVGAYRGLYDELLDRRPGGIG
jgi:glycosyltransferase involved in cell wall biosynthesis